MLLSIPFSTFLHNFFHFSVGRAKEIKKKFNSICERRQQKRQRRRWKMLFCCDTFGASETSEKKSINERIVDSIEMPEYIRIKESFIIFLYPSPFRKRLNYLNLFSLFIFSEKSEEYKFHFRKLL
jgi:hypothetical protein